MAQYTKTQRKARYDANPDVYRQTALRNWRRGVARAKQFVADWLEGKMCVNCGESDPVVLEFAHRPSTEKLADVAELIGKGRANAAIEAELTKCDVRCANCHRRQTAAERGWHSNGNRVYEPQKK